MSKAIRILALFNGKYPDGMAMANRLHYYAKALQGTTCSVDVASVQLNRSDGSYEGIRYFGLRVQRSGSLWHRIDHYLLDDLRAKNFTRRNLKNYDVLWPVGFGYSVTASLTKLARNDGKRVILEVNENPYSVGGSTFSEIRAINNYWRTKTFRNLYPKIDGFIVISTALEDLVRKHASAQAKIIKVPILNELKGQAEGQKNNQNDRYILHAGALSEKKDGILTVLKAFGIAMNSLGSEVPLKFVFTSKVALPSLLQQIEEIVALYNLKDRVVFLNHVPKRELETLMANAAMAIVHKPSNEQNDYNFPTKLGDYLSHGIPVIASDTGEMAKYLQDQVNSIITSAGKPEALAEKIRFVLDNPIKAKQIGERGRELVATHFNYTNYRLVLENFFHSLTKSK